MALEECFEKRVIMNISNYFYVLRIMLRSEIKEFVIIKLFV